MTTFKRVNIAAAVGAGLCGVAIALSPVVSAGGYECVQTATGEAPAGAPPGAVCAPLTDMAGVPMALPGPPPIAPPLVPPVVPPPLVPPLVPPPLVPPVVPPPLVPPVAGAPIVGGAPAVVGAPLTEMGGLAGKGEKVGPPAAGAPVPGQPTPPGPVT
ncbi:hypothetical protein DQP55_10380 [Mycolicibacterium sp. GF69]|uniref:hypothetical protein n=1 Tax=Mycolicibacterium sp. GF69 TaxID=2267251 RepID=UPI000DCB60C1|nr:hypothetical protein [Mycolicibacterium sp. GF69]RAV13256.1 hypothetical protein DQP55_10380 [Mycolicibacterium sp. GF69]